MRLPAVLAALMGLAACAVPVEPTRPAGPGSLSFASPEAGPSFRSFAAALNGVRVERGLGSLRSDPRLAAAARAHARDMTAHAYVSHRGRNGSTAQGRARADGCHGGYIAENIAWGQRTEEDVFVGWMNSPPHHRNMMGRPYGVYGLGESGGNWVLMFADRC